MMDVKDKVYISLQECLNESEKIPTSQIADNLHLSRQIVTHYLNQLFDEGKVKKNRYKTDLLVYRERRTECIC